MKIHLTKVLLSTALASLFLTTHAVGAVISWQTPVNVDLNNPNQVLNSGTLFTIYDVASANPTLNGVDFNYGSYHPFAISGFSGPSGLTPTPATAYSTILPSILYDYNTQSADGSVKLVFGGSGVDALTIGQTYQFQLWAGYSYPPYNIVYDRYSASAPSINGGGFSDGKYHASGESANVATANSGTEISQFVVGTFVADGATQDLYYYGEDTFGTLAAVQLRAVPEPTTIALVAFGALALVVRRRFQALGRPEWVA